MKYTYRGYHRPCALRASLLFLTLFCTCVRAQNPYVDTSGDPGAVLLFDEQIDLDTFVNGSGKYTSTNIGVTVDGGNATDPIDDLSNLDALISIGGRLTIIGWGADEETRVTGDPLSVLSSLTEVNNLEIGDFDVNNLGLITVTAPALTTVNVRSQIRNCNNLTAISLPELTDVGSTFIVDTLPLLVSLSAPKLATIGNNFQLEELDELTDLDGFGSLASIGRNMSILRLPKLTSVRGLGATVAAGRPRYTLRRFTLRGSPALDSIHTLQADVSQSIKIINNAILRDLGTDLSILTSAEEIEVSRNPLLTSMAGLLPGPGPLRIDDLTISDNNLLTDFGSTPLRINKNIQFLENTVATALPDLSATTSLDGVLDINLNPSLTSLTGLENLADASEVIISNNTSEAFTDLDDLVSLVEIEFLLIVSSNDFLSDCCQLPCQATVDGKAIDEDNFNAIFFANSGNCEDNAAVDNHCTDCSAAPVTWLTFRVMRAGGAARLQWATGTEAQNAYFGVERAVDGGAYREIGRVTGAGTTSTTTHYTYDDDDDAPAGLTYYRLRQVDHDGTTRYSRTVSVGAVDSDGLSRATVTCYPNPASGSITRLRLGSEWRTNDLRVRLTGSGGRHHSVASSYTGGAVIIDISDVPPGIYSVSVDDGVHQALSRLSVR